MDSVSESQPETFPGEIALAAESALARKAEGVVALSDLSTERASLQRWENLHADYRARVETLQAGEDRTGFRLRLPPGWESY